MFDELNGVLEGMIEDEKVMPNIAKLMKKLYDELLLVGFTDDQAATIVSNYQAT